LHICYNVGGLIGSLGAQAHIHHNLSPSNLESNLFLSFSVSNEERGAFTDCCIGPGDRFQQSV